MKTKPLILIPIIPIVVLTIISTYLRKTDSLIGIYVNEEPVFIANWELNLLPNNSFIYYYGDCMSEKYSEGFWEKNGSVIILNSSKKMRNLFKVNKGKNSLINYIPNKEQKYEKRAIQQLDKSYNEKEFNSQDFVLNEVNVNLKGISVKFSNNDTIELFENFELEIENNRLINPVTGFTYIKERN